MFEEFDLDDKASVATAERFGKVTLPPREFETTEGRRRPQYRVTLPKQTNFFEDYPRKWTWESWAKRAEQEGLMIARGIEAVIWATVGALIGLAIAAIPGAFHDLYHYVIWQPLGAAFGGVVGALLAWRRWRNVFLSHQDVSR